MLFHLPQTEGIQTYTSFHTYCLHDRIGGPEIPEGTGKLPAGKGQQIRL